MKKISIILAMACSVMFYSCDLMNTVLGTASIVITDANGGTYYAPEGPATDTIDFSSCVCDVIPIEDSSRSFLSLGANIDLTNNEKVSFPFIGVLLNDTVVGNVTLTTLSNQILYRMSMGSVLTSLSDYNVLALAACDTAWYLSNGGTVSINKFQGNGLLCEATFSNVQMKYITKHDIDYLSDLMDRAEAGDATAIAQLALFNIDTYFPTVTLSGDYSARRMNIMKLVSNLQINQFKK